MLDLRSFGPRQGSLLRYRRGRRVCYVGGPRFVEKLPGRYGLDCMFPSLLRTVRAVIDSLADFFALKGGVQVVGERKRVASFGS